MFSASALVGFESDSRNKEANILAFPERDDQLAHPVNMAVLEDVLLVIVMVARQPIALAYNDTKMTVQGRNRSFVRSARQAHQLYSFDAW